MTSMTEPRKKGRGRPPKRERAGTPLHIYIDPALDGAMKLFLSEEDPQITKTAYIESLIRADLKRRGKWPPPSTPPAEKPV